MGAAQSEVVSVIPSNEEVSPLAPRRHPDYIDGPRCNTEDCPTMKEIALQNFEKYGPRPYLAAREYLGDGKYGPEFIPKTYAECEAITYKLGYGLAKLGIEVNGMLGVYSPNNFAWIHTIDGSCMFGYCIVSLYDSLGIDSLSYLIGHSKMTGIIVSSKNLPKLIPILKADKHAVEFVIVIEAEALDEAKAGLEGTDLRVISFDEVLAMGEENEGKAGLPTFDPETPHFICYSSGTTGNPKGVIISHRACVNNTIGAKEMIKPTSETRYLSYLPLAHVFERAAVTIVGAAGGFIGFNSGSVAKLTEDMGILKPTLFAAVPRVMNRFYEGVQEKMKASAVVRGVFNTCWRAKKWCLEHGWGTGLWDAIAFNKIKNLMGGCVDQFVVGGAAMDPNIHEFLQVATGVPIRSGYGLTEAGSGNICNPMNLHSIKPGTVGGPLTNVEVRLAPIEGYDDPECGEIIVAGECVCSGYLYDEEATKNLFVDDTRRAIRTGDVGKWDKDGYLRVVDRMRSIFKLAQGEYVAADYVTQVYSDTDAVKQIFVYGDSSKTCLVAIVIPEEREVAKILGKDNMTNEELAEACNDPKVKEAIMKQMNDTAKRHKLFGYQYVKAIHLDTTEWTIDNDLLTPTFKLKRKKIGDKYAQEIEQLYADMAAGK